MDSNGLLNFYLAGGDLGGYGADTASNNAALPAYMQQRADAYGRRAAAGGIVAGLGALTSLGVPAVGPAALLVGLDALGAWGQQGMMQRGKKMWSDRR